MGETSMLATRTTELFSAKPIAAMILKQKRKTWQNNRPSLVCNSEQRKWTGDWDAFVGGETKEALTTNKWNTSQCESEPLTLLEWPRRCSRMSELHWPWRPPRPEQQSVVIERISGTPSTRPLRHCIKKIVHFVTASKRKFKFSSFSNPRSAVRFTYSLWFDNGSSFFVVSSLLSITVDSKW